MRSKLACQVGLPALFGFSFALAGLLLSSDVQGQQPPHSGPPKRHTLPLTDSDRKVLATIGWPRPLPPLPAPQDAVYTRDGQVVSGTLTFLEAFATVKQGPRKKDIAREEVGLVLIAGKPFPKKFGQLPNDDDAALLDSGEIVTGHVNLDGRGVHVIARTFLTKDVTLIRLKGPPETQYPDIEEPPESGGERGGSSGNKSGGSGSAKKPGPHRGHGPEEIPWGKALWRGFLQFKWSPTQEETQRDQEVERRNIPGLRIGRVQGSYYVTWQEDSVFSHGSYGVSVKLKLVNVVYQAVFPGCHNQAQQALTGSGVDAPGPGVPNPHSYMQLFPTRPGAPMSGGFALWPPTTQGVHCNEGGGDHDYFPSGGFGGLPLFVTNRLSECSWAGELRAVDVPPPYTTMSDSFSCSDTWGRDYHYDYAFIRGAPPINVEPDPCSACKTAQGRLAHEKDIIKSLLKDLDDLNKNIGEAKTELDRLNRVKASMHDYMILLLVAAASEDVASRLLKIVASDGATQIGGALDEESAYGLKLKGFMECLLATAPVIKGFIDHNPDYVDYVKELPRAAARPGCELMRRDVKIEEMTSDSLGDLINAAKEEVELGKVLADAIGQGTGEAEAEYIQEHLDELGPLIPQEAMQKVQQYLKLTEQWAEKLKEIEKLNVQVENDSFALADHGVAAKALEEKMGKCPSGC